MTLTRSTSPGKTRLPVKLEAVLVRLCRGRLEPLHITQAVKLPYLADVLAQRVLGRPITEGSHETWQYGVVTAEAWHHFLDPAAPFAVTAVPFPEGRRVTVDEEADDSALDADEKRIVDYVLDEYGACTASELGFMTKFMNPRVRSRGTSRRSADVHDEAYLRMTPEYQEMAQTIESLNFESMLASSTPMESPEDVLA